MPPVDELWFKLALALGIVVGGAVEFQSPDLEARVRNFAARFSGLAA